MTLKQFVKDSRERVIIEGVQRTNAVFVQQGICLARWIAIAVLPFEAISIFFPLLPGGEHLSLALYAPYSLVFSSLLGVLALILIIWFPRKIHISRAKIRLSLIFFLYLYSGGLIAGLAYFDVAALLQFGIKLFIVLLIAPIVLPALVSLFAATYCLFIIVLSFGNGYQYLIEQNMLIMLFTIFTMGVIAITMNVWHLLIIKSKSLAELTTIRNMKEVRRQKDLNDQLLISALTEPVASKIKSTGSFPPEIKDATIIACDIVDFSKYCEVIPAPIIVKELEKFFTMFDNCCLKHGVEPLRSQGDSRIAVAGLNKKNKEGKLRNPQIDAVLAMLEFRSWLLENKNNPGSKCGSLWNARIGIHTGPVIMGVIKSARMSFDAWGETVNIAARLEQIANNNEIMVSESLLWAVKGLFEHSELREVKSKNTIISSAASIVDFRKDYIMENGDPNEKFWLKYDADDVYLENPNHVDNQ